MYNTGVVLRYMFVSSSAGGILGARKQIGLQQIDVLKQQICFLFKQICFHFQQIGEKQIDTLKKQID